MVPATPLPQKKEYRSMEQYRKTKNKPTHLWSINLQQRREEYTMEKRQSSKSGAVIQSEVSQKEKNKYCMLTHIYGILKKKENEIGRAHV